MPSSSPPRPFGDQYLLAYSEEHVVYEFDMFLWLARVCGSGARLGAPTATDAARLSNVLIESFVVHLRNVIDFLYLDRPKPTDVVAADFFDPSVWEGLRPAISATLESARVRANKEIAHLTTERMRAVLRKRAGILQVSQARSGHCFVWSSRMRRRRGFHPESRQLSPDRLRTWLAVGIPFTVSLLSL
jgi:hypothetical protein